MSEELSLFDNLESMAPIPTATVLDFDFEFTPAQITIVGKDFLEQALTGYVENTRTTSSRQKRLKTMPRSELS